MAFFNSSSFRLTTSRSLQVSALWTSSYGAEFPLYVSTRDILHSDFNLSCGRYSLLYYDSFNEEYEEEEEAKKEPEAAESDASKEPQVTSPKKSKSPVKKGKTGSPHAGSPEAVTSDPETTAAQENPPEEILEGRIPSSSDDSSEGDGRNDALVDFESGDSAYLLLWQREALEALLAAIRMSWFVILVSFRFVRYKKIFEINFFQEFSLKR